MALDRELDQAPAEVGVGETGGLPELRVDAGLGEAGHRVDLVDEDLAVGLDEEVAAGQARTAAEAEGGEGELADTLLAARRGSGPGSPAPSRPRRTCARSRTTGRAPRARPGGETSTSSLPSSEHSTSRPSAGASTITRGSWRRASSTAASSASRLSTRLIPTLDPSREGFTQSGRPSAGAALAPALLPHRDEIDLGQAAVGEQPLQGQLVHADRRGEDVGADVGDVEPLEQALDAAVLAERPVQRREGDVGPQQAAAGRQGDGLPVAGPGAVAGDRHPQRLVARRLEAVGDCLPGAKRDVVL